MRRSIKFLLVFLLIMPLLIICGCETTKATVAMGAMGKGIAQGIAKDSVTAWQGIKNADAWMRENLW